MKANRSKLACNVQRFQKLWAQTIGVVRVAVGLSGWVVNGLLTTDSIRVTMTLVVFAAVFFFFACYQAAVTIAFAVDVLLDHQISALKVMLVQLIYRSLGGRVVGELDQAASARSTALVFEQLTVGHVADFVSEEIFDLGPSRIERDVRKVDASLRFG